MPQRPLVSVVIPAFQAAQFLAQTLDTVLAQTWEPLEVVVLDNASTDGTAALLERYDDPRLRVLRNACTLPLAENWNSAVRASSGELVKLVCADDVLHPQAVAEQVLGFVDPSVALVASRRHMIDEHGRLIAPGQGLRGLVGRCPAGDVLRCVVRHGGNPIGEPVAVMFRRADFDAVGGFDSAVPLPMDLDLWVRLLRHGDFVGSEHPLAAFRARRTSVSATYRHEMARQQRTLTRAIVADPHWQVGRASAAVGRIGAVRARLAREAAFAAARHPRLWSSAPILAWPHEGDNKPQEAGVPVIQRPASAG